MARRTDYPAHKSAGNRTAESTTRRPTVLLIEPDRATRQLYARDIGQQWEVMAAASVQEARQQIAVRAPVAVVLEPYTGEFAGPDNNADLGAAWAFMEEVAAGGSIPFVICSVLDERRTAYASGASLYLLKPVSPDQLVGELHRLLDSATRKEPTL